MLTPLNANKFIFCFLDIYRSVRANNLTPPRHAVFPIRAFRYKIPLRYRSVKSNTLKSDAIIEGKPIDVCHAVRDGYARKPGAIREGRITDARHAIGDGYARKSGAIIEDIIADACHAVGDGYTRKSFTTTEGTINRHRDFSCFLDSGAAFIVTPLL